jgi:hypothetical protein
MQNSKNSLSKPSTAMGKKSSHAHHFGNKPVMRNEKLTYKSPITLTRGMTIDSSQASPSHPNLYASKTSQKFGPPKTKLAASSSTYN